MEKSGRENKVGIVVNRSPPMGTAGDEKDLEKR
jgi:hypothetical protein